jgi:uncharacterized protein
MPKMIFINLPVTDVTRSTAFYEAIGMTRDARFSNEQASAMIWSEQIGFMLLHHDFYRTFTPKRIIDAHAETGALLALSFDSRAEVDDFMTRALAAGGREAHEAQDHGFMYERAVEDLDGHGLGPFWMDAAADPAAMEQAA